MLPLRTFLDTVASVVTTLDVIDQCKLHMMVNVMDLITDNEYDILDKMNRAGLIVFDRGSPDAYSIVAITPKGRALAADIRKLTTKAVKP